MEFWEHERLNWPDLAKRSTQSGNFYVANITDCDMIMGSDFMVSNAIGALPHLATLVQKDDGRLTLLSPDYTCGSSQWSAEQEDQIVRAVQAVGAKSKRDRGVQLTEYGMAPQVYAKMIEMPGTEGSAGGIGIEGTLSGTSIGVWRSGGPCIGMAPGKTPDVRWGRSSQIGQRQSWLSLASDPLHVRLKVSNRRCTPSS